jgi:ABC-2 type transport system permease protein
MSTAVAAGTPGTKPTKAKGSIYWAIHDGLVVTWRNVITIGREPELIFFGIFQPIVFIVLFALVFGGAINVPGGDYKNFLLPGVFVQTIAFAGAATSVGLSTDMSKGIVDRFRSLPMAPSAVLAGRTTGDLLRAVITVVVMSITGLVVGWRITSNWYEALAAYALLLAFGFAMSWIGCLIGLSVSSPEVANTAGLAWLFPLTFVSNAFVPIQSMPSWLQPIAAWNPVSSLVAAERVLFGSGVPITPSTPFPERYSIAVSVGWILVIAAIFIPLAIRKYRISGLK